MPGTPRAFRKSVRACWCCSRGSPRMARTRMGSREIRRSAAVACARSRCGAVVVVAPEVADPVQRLVPAARAFRKVV